MIENYALLCNVDHSILRLNKHLKNSEFIILSLEEVEKKFHDLFGFERSIESDYLINI